MTKKKFRTIFPALRCTMGDWIYYITSMNFTDIKQWIKPTDEIHKSQSLRDMIQRKLSNRSADIADYLIKQPERFFNSIVVGVYRGAPQWYSIEVNDSPVLGSPELDDNARQSIGLLKFEGNENLFAIDGQHRVEGIKQALEQNEGLADNELSVIFVAHNESETGRERTRRLFTTLNKHAKKVVKTDIIALDEDDGFAVTTRRLLDEFSLFNTGFVNMEAKSTSIPKTDHTSLTTIVTLYDIIETIYVPLEAYGRKKKINALTLIRPDNQILEQIYNEQTVYWRLLKKYLPEYNEFFESNLEEKVAGKYRISDGGHLMFRPVGQLAFARAVRVIRDRGLGMESAIKALSQVPMNLNDSPWRNILWHPGEKKMMVRGGKLLPESLFLHQVGLAPRQKNYDLLDKYRNALDEPEAKLPPIVKNLTLL